MVKITQIKNNSPWFGDRNSLVGETFEIETGTSRYYPKSQKAIEFVKEQGLEHIIFIGGAVSIPLKDNTQTA